MMSTNYIIINPVFGKHWVSGLLVQMASDFLEMHHPNLANMFVSEP